MSRDFNSVCPACGYQCMTVEQCHNAQNQKKGTTLQPVDLSPESDTDLTSAYDKAVGLYHPQLVG